VISPRLLRPLLAVAVCASVLGASSALAAPKVGPNLAPNPSFEEAFEATTIDGNYNPVPPVGWANEGATALFDYKTKVGRTGKKMVAISGTFAGGKKLCDGSSGADKCTDNPAFPVTDAVVQGTSKTYSIRPFWTTDKGIPVTAGKTYRFSAYAAMPTIGTANAGTPGEGAATQVRWLDASGKVLSFSEGGKYVKSAKRVLGFKLVTADLKAPAGAVGAELMLGHTYYTHTGTQVAFDDVAFQQLG